VDRVEAVEVHVPALSLMKGSSVGNLLDGEHATVVEDADRLLEEERVAPASSQADSMSS